jgi:flagellin
MIINHNLSAMNAERVLTVKTKEIDKTMEKLASGMRINRGADDAANLAVSEKMRSQIRGLNQAYKNIETGVSFVQTVEGYLAETGDLLQRLRELAIQASNGIYLQEDRNQIQVEVKQLLDEVNRVASHAEFNKMPVLQGNYAENRPAGVGETLYLHVGANMNQRESFYIGTMTGAALGIEGQTPVTLSTSDAANTSIGILDQALMKVNKQRADLGGYQNRFEIAIKGVAIAAENLQAAESTVRDTNMAGQMVEYVKDNILVQSGTAMLAQANTKPQSVLRLLG